MSKITEHLRRPKPISRSSSTRCTTSNASTRVSVIDHPPSLNWPDERPSAVDLPPGPVKRVHSRAQPPPARHRPQDQRRLPLRRRQRHHHGPRLALRHLARPGPRPADRLHAHALHPGTLNCYPPRRCGALWIPAGCPDLAGLMRRGRCRRLPGAPASAAPLPEVRRSSGVHNAPTSGLA